MDAPSNTDKKNLLDDDSEEDEDYVPPEGDDKTGGTLTIKGRKRVQGGIELDEDEEDEEDDDEEDDDDDDDDDYISDDADDVDNQVRNAMANGAGPSSAAGASSSVVVAENKEEEEEKEQVDGEDGNEEVENDQPEKKKAKLEEPSEKIADASTDNGTVKGRMEGENEVASKNENTIKPVSKIDALWAEMNAQVGMKLQPKPVVKESQSIKSQASTQMTSFKLPLLQDLEKAAETAKAAEERDKVSKKRMNKTGLENVLKVVRGDKSGGMIEKTREKWRDFKQQEGIEQELEAHKKDKNRYTDRVAFLQRSDLREWQFEQAGKKTKR